MTATSQPKQVPDKTKKGGLDDGHQSAGWFGGIFSKLSIKPKNQMILPDDKNPTVKGFIAYCFYIRKIIVYF